jgi:hypothetical protein
MGGSSVQTILQASLDEYLKSHRLPEYQRHALWCLRHCRTSVLGGHTEVCPEGHVEQVWYNSCRHRSCPQCAYREIDRWLEAKREQLLPCDHYHVIFTLPSELRLLWRWNPLEMGQLLFQVVRDTLMSLLEDPRHLGARPGILATLHTWGRTLVLHPHVHCLVTGGGLTANGDWKAVRDGFLLPVRVLRLIYRGKFLSKLETLLREGRLSLPGNLTVERALGLLKTVARKTWNVCIRERYRHGEGVATYLARYMRGGPIKNHRLVASDESSVTFRYGDHQDLDTQGRPTEKVMKLPVSEFLHRLLLHVPLPGFHVVRGYGLYSRTGKRDLETCRSRLTGVPGPHPQLSRPVLRRGTAGSHAVARFVSES